MDYQKAFIGVNGLGYILLGLWCAVAPEFTSALIGFTLNGPKGLAEFVAVYGGLEIGLGTFYLASLRSDLRSTAILFSLNLYSGIVLFRSFAMLFYRSPTTDIGWILYGLEVSFLIISVILYRSAHRRS